MKWTKEKKWKKVFLSVSFSPYKTGHNVIVPALITYKNKLFATLENL
jgi:hypothetical protein